MTGVLDCLLAGSLRSASRLVSKDVVLELVMEADADTVPRLFVVKVVIILVVEGVSPREVPSMLVWLCWSKDKVANRIYC